MTPPRLARAVLTALARPLDREFLLNDLDEEFQAIVETNGQHPAARWYWRQLATSLVPLAASRLASRSYNRSRHDMSHFSYARPPISATFARDFLHAARTLAKARAFTGVCVASLGLGMGTVIAIIALVRALLGTPPGVNPDGLVELVINPTGSLRAQAGFTIIDTWPYPDVVDLRDAQTGMTITGWTLGQSMLRMSEGGGAAPVSTMYVSSNYFETVGVALLRGRRFDAVHESSMAPAEAVVGHRLWQTRLGANAQIIGSTITLNRVEHVVVGVAPEGFRGQLGPEGGGNTQLWLPLQRHPRLVAADQDRFNRGADWVHLMGRLSPGTSVAQANATVAAFVSGLAARYPATHQFKTGVVEPYFAMGASRRSDVVAARATMLGLSGMVLLVVCLNISGMMFVRSAMRERELAIRLAIGASRWRLIQYHLTEAGVLSVLGGSLGAALIFGVPAAAAWWFDLWDPALELLAPDGWTVLQCVVLCFVTSLVFGLLPALRFSRPAIVSALKDDSAGSGRRVGRFHRLTAAVQAGIAVPFLVIGGVKLDQARVTALADLGFTPAGLFAAPLNLATAGNDPADKEMFLRTVQDKLAQASGVWSVTFADGLPLDFNDRTIRVSREGESTFVRAHTTRIAPGYLETLGIRLLRGRDITPDDRPAGELAVMISEPLAAQLFPGRDPLGERVAFALEGSERQVFTVVGVTADLVSTQMGNPRPQLFIALAQHPTLNVLAIARGAVADASMRRAFEGAITDVDPDFVLTRVITGEGLVKRSSNDLLSHSAFGGIIAAVALMLAALGVYGVIGFMVATRTREIGVRLALGASRWQVLRAVLVDSLSLVVPGIAGGLVLAILWVRVSDPSWYPLGGVEPLVYSVAAAISFVVAVLAGIPSARRAAAVEPIVAMRTE